MGTIACTTRLTTPGRAVCLLHFAEQKPLIVLGTKMPKFDRLGYKQPSKPYIEASAWGQKQ